MLYKNFRARNFRTNFAYENYFTTKKANYGNTTFLCYKQLSTMLKYNNYIQGLNKLDFRPQGAKV